ncbi:hypothetical protein EPN90_00475 [Patescibacteria group bacterium]|nr:MAG: hypothetical protein EPN90_00475 [Patescibacteria group bacterium]
MNGDLLQRLLALSRKTGDKIIVADGDNAFVLLPLEQYESQVSTGTVKNPTSGLATDPTVRQSMPTEEDPILAMNREVAALGSKKEPADPLGNLFDAADIDDINEEQFYLEPID